MNLLDSFSILKDVITLKDNKVQKTKQKRKRDDIDIYNSNQLKKNISAVQEKGKARLEKSRDPVRTNIISPNIRRVASNRKVVEHFNNASDSDFSEDDSDNNSLKSSGSEISVMGDPSLLLTKSSQMVDNRTREREIIDKRKGNDSYSTQFDTLKFDSKGTPVSSNAVPNSSSIDSRIYIERDLALNGNYSNFGEGRGNDNDMSYGVNNGDFSHNNMVPSFRSKSYGSQPHRDEKSREVSQRKVELFSGSATIKPNKTEV